MPRETPRQVPVRVGVLLWRVLQSAIHDTEGGCEVLARARGLNRMAVQSKTHVDSHKDLWRKKIYVHQRCIYVQWQ